MSIHPANIVSYVIVYCVVYSFRNALYEMTSDLTVHRTYNWEANEANVNSCKIISIDDVSFIAFTFVWNVYSCSVYNTVFFFTNITFFYVFLYRVLHVTIISEYTRNYPIIVELIGSMFVALMHMYPSVGP